MVFEISRLLETMVSESLKLSFNLLTAFNWLIEYSSFLAFGSVTSFFGIKMCVFENDKTDLHRIFLRV